MSSASDFETICMKLVRYTSCIFLTAQSKPFQEHAGVVKSNSFELVRLTKVAALVAGQWDESTLRRYSPDGAAGCDCIAPIYRPSRDLLRLTISLATFYVSVIASLRATATDLHASSLYV